MTDKIEVSQNHNAPLFFTFFEIIIMSISNYQINETEKLFISEILKIDSVESWLKNHSEDSAPFSVSKNKNVNPIPNIYTLIKEDQELYKEFLTSMNQEFPGFQTAYDLWLSAEESFQSRNWLEAKTLFEEVKRLFPVKLSGLQDFIQRRIKLTDRAIQMDFYIELGNNYFGKKDWERAKNNYETAYNLFAEEMPLDKDEFRKAVDICQKGTLFTEAMNLAERYVIENRWSEALVKYQETLDLFEEDFGIKREFIHKKIKGLKKKTPKTSNELIVIDHKDQIDPGTPRFSRYEKSNKIISLILVIAGIIGLTLFLLNKEPDSLAYEVPSSQAVYQSE